MVGWGVALVILVFLVKALIDLVGAEREIGSLHSELDLMQLRVKTLIERADAAEQQALANAREWLKKNEKSLRKDAITRSQHTIRGKVAEKLAPHSPKMDYDPRDMRFLGSPIDYVVFDGLSQGRLEAIVFVEVKTGHSRLSPREAEVERVLEESLVWFEEVRLE